MIRARQQLCTIADDVFTTAYETIVKSGAAQSIKNYWRQSSRGGGRKAAGINYTVVAVLVGLLVRFLIGRPYSLRGAMDTLGEFSADQLAAVGMAGQDCTAIRVDAEAEYKRFHRFWNLRLQPLDPDFDLPAKRMTNAEFHARLPMAEPDWPADAMACCSNSSITVYLTEAQLKMAQWDLIPGSWEHTLYFEAARALTEQRFSQLKSRHVAGLDSLTTGPRRTPMIKIAIALAAVTVNIRAQQNHDPKKQRSEAIDIRLRQLAADLGYPPTPMPRRS